MAPLFVNNVEQWGVKRDWNLNRIDAPHAIITPLVRLTRVSETLLVESLLLKNIQPL